MSPRVTVLVAVKDGLPWIREAVDSVLAQTFTEFELLIVDDGSTDGTGDAVAGYGDARIRVLRNERNLGQVPSLNRGLAEARGEYVARLDADDRMLPARLERQLAVLDAEPAVALVGTWMDVVDEHGHLWGRLRGHVRDYPEFVGAILRDRYPFAHPAVTFRRSVVLELGGYDASLAPSEDKDLFRRLALAQHDARCVEEPLVLYRRHNRQLSQEQWDVQKRHDWEGQNRFLVELGVPPDRAEPLRLLLAGDPEAWRREPVSAFELEHLLAGARERLDLDEAETRRLERLIARGVAAAAAGAWRAGATAQWTRTPGVAVHAARHGAARDLPAYALAVIAGPLAYLLRRVVGGSAPGRQGRVRAAARRSRLLRRIYARLLGS